MALKVLLFSLTTMPSFPFRSISNIKIRHTFKFFSTASNDDRKKVVFLGTPDVAANCLQYLFDASKDPSSDFLIAGVVTQPPAPSGRNKKVTPSPVHLIAENFSLPLFIPEKANDSEFLSKLSSISPDLCITAAYGNYLPKKFLSIPKYGTLNIHPSMLPKYRGASPVQRALENGDKEIGISILKTVSKMDAGPILSQLIYPLNGHEKADEVLKKSFQKGIEELLRLFPKVWEDTAPNISQNDEEATLAAKLTPEEAYINFATMNAVTIHNRCRGFAIWPGIWSSFLIGDSTTPQRIKIITTTILDTNKLDNNFSDSKDTINLIKYNGKDIFQVYCEGDSTLGIIEIQPSGKKTMSAKDFFNGLRGQTLKWSAKEIE